MTCFLYAMLGVIAVFGLRRLGAWLTYVNNRD
jgi:hypothetical protein